jgi:replicative DNA helicase
MSQHAYAYEQDTPETKSQPGNLEAEQALLGCLLFDNEALHALDGIRAGDFREPFHGRLYANIAELVGKGLLAEPIICMEAFKADPAFEELGGIRYLADLVDRAPPAANAPDYARVIVDLSRRRELIKLSGELGENARDSATPTLDVIGKAEASLLAMQVTTRETKLVTAGQAADNVLRDLENPAAAANGIMTHIPPLDRQLGPLLGGDLLLLQGRPSMGKSAAAECVAMNMAAPGLLAKLREPFEGASDHPFVKQWTGEPEPVGVIQINGEMSPEQMVRRHMADLCFWRWGARGPKYSDIRKRNITADQLDMLRWAKTELDRMPLLMLKRPGLKLSQLRSLARRQKVEWARRGIRLGAVIMDHAGHAKPDGQVKDRYEGQTLISGGFKELADELDSVFIALNQMNRENEKREDKRPQLSDLRDSGSWEQDADFVIGWYREAYYAQREAEPKNDLAWSDWDRRRKSRTIEAIVLKAREGECGTVELWGDVARNAIRGSAPEDGDLL